SPRSTATAGRAQARASEGAARLEPWQQPRPPQRTARTLARSTARPLLRTPAGAWGSSRMPSSTSRPSPILRASARRSWTSSWWPSELSATPRPARRQASRELPSFAGGPTPPAARRRRLRGRAEPLPTLPRPSRAPRPSCRPRRRSWRRSRSSSWRRRSGPTPRRQRRRRRATARGARRRRATSRPCGGSSRSPLRYRRRARPATSRVRARRSRRRASAGWTAAPSTAARSTRTRTSTCWGRGRPRSAARRLGAALQQVPGPRSRQGWSARLRRRLRTWARWLLSPARLRATRRASGPSSTAAR
ncbi:unnamed protein product, partial [Prorocentrum cordatum]